MTPLDSLFQQFLRERNYIHNVSPATIEWYEWAWKAFIASQARVDDANSGMPF